MKYCVTTALERIQAMQNKVRIVQGGTSAGKTIAILLDELNEAIAQPNILTSVVADTMPALKHGAMRDFMDICNETNILSVAQWNKTESTLTLPNGSAIEFFSADSPDKVRGPKRDRLFLNEANRIPWDTFSYLETATRQKVTIDFNPVAEFWAHKTLMGDPAWKDAVEFVKLTYKDNEGLDDATIESIERRKGDGTSNWWKVFGMGEVGSLEGNIYSGWLSESVENITCGKLIRYGLDFGFSNDESGLVAVYDMGNEKLGLIEVIYEKGLLGSQYPERLRSAGVDPSVLIVADSARPEIIAELKQAGFRIVGADKGPGSVKRGIDRVSERAIIYNGKNLEKEFYSYAWRTRRDGQVLDEPQDGNDHLMDALRYAIDDLKKQRFDF